LSLANEHLKAAEVLYNGGIWLIGAFYCHQAIKKLSTGLYVIFIKNNYQYSHNNKEILIQFESYLPVQIPQNTYDFVE
jgi:HEPN domain-containing protein